MGDEFHKSIFTPVNREKYVGHWPIVARSSWETKMMKFLDSDPRVLQWSSESIVIGYINPITHKPTRYYPDFLVKLTDGTNEWFEVIEIKPYKQTIPPKITKGKKRKTILTEAKAWALNSAKWTAALAYCQARNFRFRIMTERELNIR